MKDWILQKLADVLQVAPPESGEAISPRLRFDQPWAQWLLIAVVLGGSSSIIWLYRREGRASATAKFLLAGIRIALLLLLVFMISEAVLSVERTGLPYVTIMIDDSASVRIADQYERPGDAVPPWQRWRIKPRLPRRQAQRDRPPSRHRPESASRRELTSPRV